MLITSILIALICGIIGYLIGKNSQKSLKNEDYNYKSDLEACNQKNNLLMSEVDTLKSQLNKASSAVVKSNFASESTAKTSNEEIAFDAVAAKAVFGKKIKQDDLKIVEGIGPKIE